MESGTEPHTRPQRKSSRPPTNPNDRGPAKYFHGRLEELALFESSLDTAKDQNGRTTFLIQGPPGAGKTALLHECGKKAITRKWVVTTISIDALLDPVELASDLDQSYATQTTVRTEGGGSIGMSFVGELDAHYARGHDTVRPGRTLKQILKKAGQRKGLVLKLDEAQRLGAELSEGSQERRTISLCLDAIHNGNIGAPVMLLAGGLGTTDQVFASFGISCFRLGLKHNLGSLAPAEAAAVIKDWLVNEGGAPENHAYLPHWIHTLAAECHGWPQHLAIYAQYAAGWLEANRGMLTAEVPMDVLGKAREGRVQYYLDRVSEFDYPHRQVLANLLQQKKKNAALSTKEVITALSAYQSGAKAEKMFDLLLLKGVIAKTPDGALHVPIPSMHDWLVRRYAERT